MKIFLPIKLQKTGGTSTFARKFQAGMAKHGHQVFFKYRPNYDILLVSPRCDFKYLVDAKKRSKKIVHRLDGIYYPATVTGWLFPLYNLPLQITHHFFSDYTIYQSQYSKTTCDAFLGKTNKPNTIIYNGADTNQFTPNGPKKNLRDNPDQHVFITWSRFRRPDQINPLLDAFKIYRNKFHTNSKFVIIGNFSPPYEGGVPPMDGEGVIYAGTVNNQNLPQYARAADVFLFSQQNPPCPNNVIEAMACGLPICGVADGSMPELVTSGQNGELIPVNNPGWWRFRKLNSTAMAANMDNIMKNKSIYSPKKLSLNTMINQYLNVFDQILV